MAFTLSSSLRTAGRDVRPQTLASDTDRTAVGAAAIVGVPADLPASDADTLPGPSPEVARCVAADGWWLDFYTEAITDASGAVTGYLEVTTGPGFSSVNEYDAAMTFVRSEYRDDQGYRSSTHMETLLDPDGAVNGYRETSSGSGSGFSYESSALYDADFNLIEADHVSSDGYRSTTRRTELLDPSGTLSGYQLDSSGGDDESSYSSTEVFDRDYQLLSSDFSSSDGYSSTYRLEISRDASGDPTGYVTTYSWTHGNETYSSVDRFDADWNLIGSDTPVLVVDDGPTILPVVRFYSEDSAREARSEVEFAAVAAEVGSGDDGAQLQGSNGDDTFFVDDVRDRVKGAANGDDMLVSNTLSLDLQRKAYKGVENASLVGRDDLRLRGDAGNNALSGNAGDNHIDGGRGTDSLFGGLGNDIFVIRGGERSGADRVADFTSGEDQLALVGSRFERLFNREGKLRDGVFGDRLVFDAETGEVVFDQDGDGGPGTGTVVAILVGVSGIDTDDFIAG